MLWLKAITIFLFGTFYVDCESDADRNEFKSDEEPNDLLPGLYPTYRRVPQTGFSCLGKHNWNYYADLETDCQVFHICETQYSKLSFLCPIGSVFNQRHLVCDWWYNVECQDALSLYPENNLIEEEPLLLENSDLSLASSGGNDDPKKEISSTVTPRIDRTRKTRP